MLNDLHRRYVNGELSRRGFIRGAAAAIAAGASVPAWMLGHPAHAAAAQAGSAPGPALAPLDLAEWSYFFVGVERIEMARGSFVNGKQMYVESFIPAQVRHPYPIVLVHGGGGQGLDWMGTPDGRRGWTQILLEEGYKVYVVDRPGHGRSPFHPDVDGPFPAQNLPLEQMSGQFTPPNAARPANNELRKLHNQWPGTGEIGSRDLDQLVASQGGSYVQVGGGPGAPPAGAAGRGGPAGGGRGAGAAAGGGGGQGAGAAVGRGGPPAVAAAPPVLGATGMPAGGPDSQHMVWRQRGAMLLDKIGPAIIMTHSAGGPFGWLVAEIRPNLVKGIVAIEGGGQPFGGGNVWGMSSIPVAYDPPVSEPSEIKTKRIESPEPGVNAYLLQEEPARKLKNLQNIPIVIVTAEASFASPGNPGGVAYFKQAGCKAEEMRLVTLGIHGNGHMMMVEKNNREVLKPILAWIEKNVNGSGKGASSKPPAKKEDSTAMKLADTGYFWVGTEHKKMPYGTIVAGQMFVQYLTPAEVRHPYPVVLVHGGGGTALHYMGVGEKAGWAHYYVQEGYRVYLVDRPGHGRAPYHPDALGPIGGNVSYAAIAADTRRAAVGPNHQWPGTGDNGDPLLDQMLAGQNAAPQDNVFAHTLWASRGAELLDKIGPAIIQVHSAGGPFSWIVTNERPNLVKAIINVEGGGQPFAAGTPWGLTDVPVAYDPPASDPAQIATRDVTVPGGATYKLQADPPRKLKNLQNIPTIYVVGEKSGRNGAPVVAFLKQAGVDAEEFNLKDKGILGNGHFMMLENNRRQVFDAIRGWLEQKIPTKTWYAARMPPTSAAPTPELYFDTVLAYQRTAALRAAVHLDLFTAIDGPDGARTIPDIAARIGAAERSTTVLCDYLTIIGFLQKSGGTYALTPDSATFLSTRSPAYLGSTTDFLASAEMMGNFDTLTDTIRRGTIAPVNNNTVADDNPVWVRFARAMAPMMMPPAFGIADALDVASAGPLHVLDIAAGHGAFGIVLAQRNPRVDIVALDWAAVLEVARENAERAGVGDRYRLLPGDAFKVDFGTGFDVVLVTNFLHHFDRATNVSFMRKVAGALKPGGRAAVLEFVPNDDHISPPMAAGFSLTMLAGTPSGTAYTFAELQAIALEAGFSSATAHPVPPQTIVVAVK